MGGGIMGKLSTPNWIREGFDSKADWEKSQGKKTGKKLTGKTFKLKVCPECGNNNVNIVLVGEEGEKADNWQCRSCKWRGKNIEIKEVSAEELMELGDKK